MIDDVEDQGKAGGRARPVRQLPEASRFWIAYSPRTWRCSSTLWTDIARLDLGGMQKPLLSSGIPEMAAEGLDDLLYVPPVDPTLAEERDRLAAGWVESGTPVLAQLKIGESCAVQGAHLVYDLLDPLLSSETEEFLSLPEGSMAVWPLIPGISDHPGRWEDGLPLLAHAGVRCVQPVALDLSPVQRRRLAEGRDDSVFDALFHSSDEGGGERDFARYAHQHGLSVFMERPEVGIAPRQKSNREIAGLLALAGELWLRQEKSISVGQAFFRAARGAETFPHDLVALVREDNLKVINWLNDTSRELVESWVQSGRSELLETLMSDYVQATDREESV